MDKFREQSRVVRADGSVSYDAFEWNAGAWFGAMLGSSCWMGIVGIVQLVRGDTLAGAIALLCLFVALVLAIGFWRKREHIKALPALNIMLVVLFLLTIAIMASVQFLASAETRAVLNWGPMVWLVLLIFPALALQFYFIQRNTEKNLLKLDRQEKAD